MNDSYSIVLNAETNIIKMAGELTFSTVGTALTETEELFTSITDLDIDLADVSHSDSAGLALLVHWVRTAKTNNKKIVFHNIPSQILSIADASGLDKLLPVQ
jgi:phospholipid transport system transporter-binding protein